METKVGSAEEDAHRSSGVEAPVADRAVDGLEDEESEDEGPPDPVKLKEEGNEAYRKGASSLALDLWSEGLKILLKESVRGLVREGSFDMCLTFRLNMAQAHIQLENWIEALDQLEVVLDQNPDCLKALYRKSQVLLALQEWDKCEQTVKRAQEVEPENAALRQILQDVAKDRRAHTSKAKAVYSKMFGGVLNDDSKGEGKDNRGGEGTASGGKADEEEEEGVGPAGVQWNGPGHSDDPQAELWTATHTGESLKGDDGRRPLVLSLPFTLLHALSLCTTASAHTQGFSDDDRKFFDRLSRKQHVVIHIVGARGDSEMDCMWTALLDRLPRLKSLSLICIGFMDETDLWGIRLNQGVLSPSMHKKLPPDEIALPKQMTCRLFKGYYQLFLETHSAVLSDPRHQYHPDMVVIAEPSFSRHFDSWIPAIVPILQNQTFCVMSGYSALDFDSHDAANITGVLSSLGTHFVLPIQRNPYAVKIQPPEGTPPMPCFQGYSTKPLMYTGASAKNAVFCAFRGRDTSDSLPTTPREIRSLKSQLRAADVDVDIGEVARRKFHEDFDASEAAQNNPPTQTEHPHV